MHSIAMVESTYQRSFVLSGSFVLIFILKKF